MHTIRWLGFIAAAASLAATTASQYLAAVLEPQPSVILAETTGAAVPASHRDPRGAVRLFPQRAATTAITGGPLPSPESVTRRYVLLATMVSNDGSLSSAFVMSESRTAWLVRRGDAFDDYVVEEIRREPFRVEVWNRALQRRESILGRGEAVPELASPPRLADIRTIDATHRIVPRASVDAALTNLEGLAQEALWMPLLRDGRTIGWQVRNLRPGSTLEAIGLRSGDTVLRINGLDLGSPERALEAWQRLRDAVVLDVELDRGGAPLRMNYRIDG